MFILFEFFEHFAEVRTPYQLDPDTYVLDKVRQLTKGVHIHKLCQNGIGSHFDLGMDKNFNCAW